MAWSTRELAALAGTTVNAVRHYHRIALLDEPTRRHNGYKQYGVPDLIRLRCIRRLSELGVPLSQIREICAGDATTPDVLRQVDAGLASEIERLRRARTDIATILRDPGAVVAPEFRLTRSACAPNGEPATRPARRQPVRPCGSC